MGRIAEFIRNWCLIGLAAFPALPAKVPSYLIMLAVICSIFQCVQKRKSISREQVKLFCSATGFFFFIPLFALMYPDKAGFSLVERSLFLLAGPLIFILNPVPFKPMAFAMAPVVFVVTLLWETLTWNLHFWIYGFRRKYAIGGEFEDFYRMEWNDLTQFHPTYYTLLACIAAFMLIRSLMASSNWKLSAFISVSAILIFFTESIVLAARAPLAIGLLLLPVIIWTATGTRKRKFILLALWGICISGGAIWLTTQNQRFRELIPDMADDRRENTLTMRNALQGCGWKLVEEHPFAGMPAGEIEPAMESCVMEKQIPGSQRLVYNTHNQYIHYWLTIGMPGLIGFLLFLLFLVYYFYRKKDGLGVTLVLLYAGCFFFENILSRQMGVIPFVFFIGLLLHKHIFPQVLEKMPPVTTPSIRNPFRKA